ncbi:hypothetical protein BAUCODRAFT_499289 [Baudoinia panamericana UAMH 10762]|uniref:ASST-domain-containing protein n=1 Tax=Baudoinia panamericana (strain UAMH 10762) TaxID=717646 RepID=M2NA15_BAUPA|nr:uncharacterized protein BAUCODRAFT_499289 [Baudoinia panamericana UAMH 10762]EMC95695.1 hypothetical protein BAUCODRAFT_499289 [Baudoinia panamericana UAMH 10762]
MFSIVSLLSCFFVPILAAHSSADEPPFFQSGEYNAGEYGKYVTQNFITANVTVPRLNVNRPFTNCDDGSYLFIAPRGEVANSSVCILDASGSLVWCTSDFPGQAYNLQVQEYRGQKYLTYWAGNNSLGHGIGKYYMLDQHYELFRAVDAAGNMSADLHSFDITPEGTAVLTVYDMVFTDLAKHFRKPTVSSPSIRQAGIKMPGLPPLRPGRPSNTPPDTGWIWDSLFQEIDLETGELLFQWRASDHYSFGESYDPLRVATEQKPWDWFHINSVEKDAAGNYLVSARHMRCIAYISGEDGRVLWQVGGRANSFKEKSAGRATNYIGQHDAHWVPGSNTSITFFDNRGDWTYHTEQKSMGTRIELNFDDMSATLGKHYAHEKNVYSVSQGSYQTLPNGHVVLGYGNNGVMTEFDEDGNILCDAYFEPSKDWTSGNVQSYRNMKFNWTGMPKTSPSLELHEGALYMSWLGSTETDGWLLLHSSSSNGSFKELLSFPKAGFETRYEFEEDVQVREFVKIGALNKDGHLMAISYPVSIGDRATVAANVTYPPEAGEFDDLEDDYEADEVLELEETLEDLEVLIAFALLAGISTFLVCWLFLGLRMFRPLRTLKHRLLGFCDDFSKSRVAQVYYAASTQTAQRLSALLVSVSGGRRWMYRSLEADDEHELSASSSEFSGGPP